MSMDELDAFRTETRRFVDEVLLVWGPKLDREQILPPELIGALAERGFLGGPRSAKEQLVVHQEVARAHVSLENLLTVSSMSAAALQRSRRRTNAAEVWLPALKAGRRLIAFALTEPHSGSDLGDVRLRIERAGDRLILDGEKKWISFAELADAFIVLGRTTNGLAAVLVERGTPGLAVEPIRDMLAFRANMMGTLVLRDCRVSEESMLDHAPSGVPASIMFGLHSGRFTTACGSSGLARAALDAAVEWVRGRSSGGKPLYQQPLVQKMLAESIVAVKTAHALCESAAGARDRADASQIQETLIAKYHASRAARLVTDHALQIMGAAGAHASSPVERWFREARLMELIEGTTQVHESLIALGHVLESET